MYYLPLYIVVHGLATYFRFSFRFFKKGSCQLLAKVCARSSAPILRIGDQVLTFDVFWPKRLQEVRSTVYIHVQSI